ncbi:hypothetical protein VTK73DRAFT_5023 [Phialemonium thermophilum]|uniref:Uncharacterized protein n=1 Tax=Phialemonium thermophilum TaxID=223376 RepID=A0ABR3V472_9PEZI
MWQCCLQGPRPLLLVILSLWAQTGKLPHPHWLPCPMLQLLGPRRLRLTWLRKMLSLPSLRSPALLMARWLRLSSIPPELRPPPRRLLARPLRWTQRLQRMVWCPPWGLRLQASRFQPRRRFLGSARPTEEQILPPRSSPSPRPQELQPLSLPLACSQWFC